MNEHLGELWKMIYDELKNYIPIPDKSINLWFGDMELKYISEAGTLYFSVYYYAKKDFIENHYQGAFSSAIEAVVGFSPKIVIISTERDSFENQFAELVASDTDELRESSSATFSPEEAVSAKASAVSAEDEMTLMRSVFPPEKEYSVRKAPNSLNEAVHRGVYAPKKFNNERGIEERTFSDYINDTSDGVLLMSPSTPPHYPSYTFENFVVGNSNKLAYQYALQASRYPAQTYNPLFIYGSPGLGKTHLLYAITNEIMRLYPTSNIIYVKGDDFTNELVEAIKNRTPVQFREKYRNCDVLLMDDVQFIAGRESTQEEFFHTFNSLYETGKQIILTCDKAPKDINGLEERLRSRFEGGPIVKIDPPELELRTAIVKKKFELMKIDIPNDVLIFLAENIKDNIRQIEGVIKKMNAYCLMCGEKITLELAQKSVTDIIDFTPTLDYRKILLAASEKYGISTELILGKRKTGDVVRARHFAIYVMKKLLPDITVTEIARTFNRDHATILAALEKIEKEVEENPAASREVSELIDLIKLKA